MVVSDPYHEQRSSKPITVYVDGAGGDRMPWARDVLTGLERAGVTGSVLNFSWYTGQGLVADHTSTVPWKRRRAAELAARLSRAPQRRAVNILAFSAGTAIAAYTLQDMPAFIDVDTVVFLASSLSSAFDLGPVMQRLNRLFVFTSNRDLMLRLGIPLFGTADRRWFAPVAGINGFATQSEKLESISWTPRFRAAGNYGRHSDFVQQNFVRLHVAPLLFGRSQAATAA